MTTNGNANAVQSNQNTDASLNANANAVSTTDAGNFDGAVGTGNRAAAEPQALRGVPDSSWKKAEIRKWVDENGVDAPEDATKAELLDLI
jgi:hypothetical protein